MRGYQGGIERQLLFKGGCCDRCLRTSKRRLGGGGFTEAVAGDHAVMALYQMVPGLFRLLSNLHRETPMERSDSNRETKYVETTRSMDNWSVRRLFMLFQMVFCKVVIGYVLWYNLESRVAETAVDFAFVLMGTIILAYVFGATYEDISKARLRKP